jgi:CubicO group peptidase (beta-lactamase class C family)
LLDNRPQPTIIGYIRMLVHHPPKDVLKLFIRKIISHILFAAALTSVVLPVVVLANPSPTQMQFAAARGVIARYNKAGQPGAAVGVLDLRTGRWLLRTSYGVADMKTGRPIKPDTIFGVGSVSKQFTAAAVAIASAEGYFSLDDEIRKYIPEMPDFGAPITISDLIHHLSGLRDDVWLRGLTGHPNGFKTQEDVVRLYARQKGTNFRPGTEHLYSNSGYLLLSLLIKRTTHMALPDYAHRMIFAPLGMKHTAYSSEASARNHALPYSQKGTRWEETPIEPAATYGPTGLMTTIDDYALWARNLFAAKSKLAGGTTLTSLLQQPAHLRDGTAIPYGFGFDLKPYRGVRTVAHAGSSDGYRADAMMFPKQGFAVIALANDGNYPDPLVMALADIFLGDAGTNDASQRQTTRALPAERLPALAGTYVMPHLGFAATVTVERDGLHVDDGHIGGRVRHFRPIGPQDFINEQNVLITFSTTTDGATLLQILSDQYRKIEPIRLTAEQLKAYAGDYHSDELQVTYHVDAVDNGLAISMVDADADAACLANAPCIVSPTTPDAFTSIDDRLSLHFTRVESRPTGFSLAAQHGRVTNIVFKRN